MPKTKPMNAMISERAPNAELPYLPTGRSLHHVSLFCGAKAAARVFLVGDFNHWDPTATPMNRMPDGQWMASLELPHGHHRYLFLVDGEAQLDANANASGVECNERVSPIAVS